MSLLFFSPSQVKSKNRLSRESNSQGDDTEASTDQTSSSGTISPLKVDRYNTRAFRLNPPNETQEEKLERLMRNAEKFGGLAQSNYLEQLVIFLTQYPDFVNRVPKNFHSNPLELVIKIGDLNITKELLKLKANVRPENQFLLSRIKHLLKSSLFQDELEKNPNQNKKSNVIKLR